MLPSSLPSNPRAAGIKISVPPGGVSSYQFAVCFYRAGSATASTEMSYYYTRFFRNVEAVGAFALNKWKALTDAAHAADGLLSTGKSHLSPTQQFMMAHATRRATPVVVCACVVCLCPLCLRQLDCSRVKK